MKVLHVITGLKMGGAERSLLNLIRGGMLSSYKCHVVSLTDKGKLGSEIEDLGVSVSELRMSKGVVGAFALLRLNRLISEIQPDLVQGWMYHGNLASSLSLLTARRRPVVVWNIRHSVSNLSYESFFMRQVIRANKLFSSLPSKIIYNSFVSRHQHENLGYSKKNGVIIPNGIDIHKYSPSSADRLRLRSSMGIPDDDLVVGHVARFHPMKGHSLFLKAAVALARRHSNVQFILCGRDILSSNKWLSQLIPDDLRSRFHFLGESSDSSMIMNAFDVFCSSSIYGEGFSNVLGEAMASAVPCVATAVGDSDRIVSSFGSVVPPNDEAQLVASLDDLLVMDSCQRHRLGRLARRHILENYSLEQTVVHYVKLYNNLTSRIGA